MLEIKTIIEPAFEQEMFDEKVNVTIAEGWDLIRRDILVSRGDQGPLLYAELERDVEPEEAEDTPEDDGTAEWKLSRDPAYPYKCSACGCKNPEPAKLCLNCKRKMRNV
jgi:hypothetical protein